MGTGDRKSQMNMRQERTFTFRSVADDGDSASFEKADSPPKTAIDLSSMLSELAQVPSPQSHRRRFSAPADLANAEGKPPKEILWLEASVPVSGSYREQLRANGQQTLQRAREGGCLGRPCPPPLFPPPLLPPPTVGPSLVDGGSSNQNSASDVMANQEQYTVLCQAAANNGLRPVQAPSPVSLSQALSPTWTTPTTASCFFPEAGREMPQAPMMGQFVMPTECHQATQLLLLPHNILPMPLTPTGAGKDTDDLMAIAMPQAANCVMNAEQIVAHLRAAAPVQYDD